MKISGRFPCSGDNIPGKSRERTLKPNRIGDEKDLNTGGKTMNGSRKLKMIRKMQEEFLRLDQNRSDEIEDLKTSYAQNAYDVPGRKIAEKMINELLLPPTPRI